MGKSLVYNAVCVIYVVSLILLAPSEYVVPFHCGRSLEFLACSAAAICQNELQPGHETFPLDLANAHTYVYS